MACIAHDTPTEHADRALGSNSVDLALFAANSRCALARLLIAPQPQVIPQ